MEDFQEEIEKLLDVITVILVQLDEIGGNVPSEIKLILDKSRNEVKLIQDSLLDKFKQEEDFELLLNEYDPLYDQDMTNDECFKEEHFQPEVKSEVRTEDDDEDKLKDGYLDELAPEITDENTAVKISFKMKLEESNEESNNDSMFYRINKCNMCDYTSSTTLIEFKRHLDKAHGVKYKKGFGSTFKTKVFQCKQCDFSSPKIEKTKHHIEIAHKIVATANNSDSLFEKFIKCKQCDYTTSHITELKHHLKKAHSIEYKPFSGPGQNLKQAFHSIIYQCRQCEYKCQTDGAYTSKLIWEHIAETHYVPEDAEDANIPETYREYLRKEHSLSERLQSDSWCERNFKCKQCDYTVTDLSDLRQHLKTVHSIKRIQGSKKAFHTMTFQCRQCDYSSRSRSNLKRHVDTIHNQSNETCDICGHVCKSKHHLRRHIRMKHEAPEGQTKCDKCYKCFSDENFDGHTCEVPSKPTLICNTCGKVYYSKSSLERHILIEHEKGEIPKPFFCHLCDHRCETKHSLKAHMLSHEEKPPCPECGERVRHLQLHMRSVHTPDELKKYQCQDCGKGFDNKNRLEIHRMNIHLKLRPYNCRYGCDVSYNDTSNRNAHEKKTHGKMFTTVKEEKLKARMEN